MNEILVLSTLTALSAPVYVAVLGVEIAWCRARGLPYHDLRETVGSLSAGIGEQAISGLLMTPLLLAYQAIEVASPLSLPSDSPWTWLFALVGVDFLFYWFHRACHVSGVTWAMHVVHHQSRDFNLSVALRNSFLGKIVQLLFMVPLALAGVPVTVFALVKLLTLYHAFWVHTRTIGRVGVLERILVTPAHHRVHHARNPRFMNHNFGGLFIFWDKWFGTFQEEDEESFFHAVPDHPGLDPVRANLAGWEVIVRQARAAGSWRGALTAVFGAPHEPDTETNWRPGGADAEIGLLAYAVAQMVAILPGMALVHAELGALATAFVAGQMLAALSVGAGLLEGRPWALGAERARLALLSVVGFGLAAAGPLAAGLALVAWSLGSVAALHAALGQREVSHDLARR